MISEVFSQIITSLILCLASNAAAQFFFLSFLVEINNVTHL